MKMYNYRKCQELDHQQYETSHICTFKGCDKSVILCAICIQKDIHQHGQLKQDHIVNLKQFQQQTQQIKQSIYDQNERKGKLIKNIQSIIETQLQEIISNTKQYNFQQILQIIDDIQKNDFIKSDKQQIKKIINIQDEINQQDKILIQIEDFFISKLQDLENTIKNYNNVVIPQVMVDYTTYYDYYCNKGIETAHISANEKFLAFGQNNNKLTIINLRTKETVEKINFNSSLTSCRFTNNSNFLFVGDQLGFIYCYDDNFNEIYNYQVCFKSVKGIKFMDDSRILFHSDDQQIFVCDMNDLTKLLKIKSSEQVMGIEYYKLHDKIISFCRDINFYDGQTGKSVFKQQNIHDKQSIVQIQIIELKQQMISSNENMLILWQIDQYILSKLKTINLNSISNMSVVSNGNLIMIVLKNCIHFYDGALNKCQDFDIIDPQRKNKQDLNNIVCMRNIQQINSMNFIILQRRGSIQVLEKLK